jgi:hypothetical protein
MGCSTNSLWTVVNNRAIRVATKRELVCLGTSLLSFQVSSLAILEQGAMVMESNNVGPPY